METNTIIILDDDVNLRHYYSMALTSDGFRVIEDGNSGKIMDLIEHHRPSLIISDLVMPDHEGIEGIFQILGKHPVPVIAISSYPKYLEIAKPLVRLTLCKPVSAEDLVEGVHRVLTREAARRSEE